MKLLYFYLLKSLPIKNKSQTKRPWAILIHDTYIYKLPITNFRILNKKCIKRLDNTSILNLFFNETKYSPKPGPDLFNVYIHIYKQNFMSSLLKTPTLFKSINMQDIIHKELLAYMMYSARSIKWKKFYIMHSNEIIEMLFLCLWLKNINLFIKWVRKYFEKNNLKKHKKLFLLFKYLLGSFIWNHNLLFRLRGIRFILRGKFGKAGSVRKSRKYIKRGKCSYTTKNIALVNQTKVIRTATGVFSIKLEIFF